MTRQTEAAEARRTPCCQYEWHLPDAGPIFWNPYNNAVQCHNCGGVYDFRDSAAPAHGEGVKVDKPRACTCHPDDNPPVPCPQKYALTECRQAAALAAPAQHIEPGFPHLCQPPRDHSWVATTDGGRRCAECKRYEGPALARSGPTDLPAVEE